jgi:hypothetical protein
MSPASALVLALLTRLALAPVPAHAQVPAQEPVQAHPHDPTTAVISSEEMQRHVDFLASDQLAGRDAGKPGAELAADYVARHFARLGLQPVADGWQVPFDLPGGAGPGSARLELAGEVYEEEAMLQAPSFSAVGDVTARLAMDSEDVAGRLVLVAGGDRVAAAEQLARGAAGVILLSDRPALEPRRDRGDFRRLGPGGPDGALPFGSDEAGEEGAESDAGPADLSGLPDALRERVEQRLRDMGLDPDTAGVQVKVVTGDSGGIPEGIELPEADDESGFSFQMGGPGMFGAVERLTGPVATVAGPVGKALAAAAAAGNEVRLAVTRPGVDRSTNVLALLPGTDPVLSEEVIVVGGHYDHVGAAEDGRIWNGADDNASGTSAVLEIAEVLAARPAAPRRSVLFAAWGAEESGLVGSTAFGDDPPVPMDRIVAFVNLDMISRNAPDAIELVAAGDSLRAQAEEAARAHGLEPERGASFFLNASDTQAFVRREVPTVFFFCGTHEDYHQASDDPHTIDADKAARVARAARDVVLAVADADERPVFTAPPRGEGGFAFMGGEPPDGRRRLGVMVDATSDGQGLVVRQVVPGSVAATAGVAVGDRLMRVGDETLASRTELRAALSDIEPGRPFEILISRDGADQVLEAVFPADV